MNSIVKDIWLSSKSLSDAFGEYKVCLEDIYEKAGEVIRTSEEIPREFKVGMGNIPDEFFLIKRNIFSTIFQSIYHILDIRDECRLLYGKFNHLFRIWVTSADNLLDNEDKVVIPIDMPGSSRVMRQVVSIMAADRIMKRLLDEAETEKVITGEESMVLSRKSLEILLPSAAEEASEEGGISSRPEPDYVLYTIHRLKTGMLFHIPFMGPDNIEKGIDIVSLNRCKDALDKFGLGCQILDDIRDLAKDFIEKRHNYILSTIYHNDMKEYVKALDDLKDKIDISGKIGSKFPEVVRPAAKLAKEFLTTGLKILSEEGLSIEESDIERMSSSMFGVLDVVEFIC
ncbi:MAG: hypothetical protein AUJ75_03995 [Candidatus Omnitrophica bacterium CG1_02_49_10]|nr:MAG: hypothetical protein AUJ75_03995 [Candidatus Omnitrophica bacterium CG1_02_49_10]